MSHGWASDIKKYAASCDIAAADRIVKYLGIALQSRDASIVACHDKVERVRDHFLKKEARAVRPGLRARSRHHGSLRADEIGARLSRASRSYYLLAEKYGKLATLHPR